MTAERAMQILQECREIAPILWDCKRRIEQAKHALQYQQKLIATYGKERVKGGKAPGGIEEIIIKGEATINKYRDKRANLMPYTEKARAVVACCPKKWWAFLYDYYVKGVPVHTIAKKNGWCLQTVYNWKSRVPDMLKKVFDK